MLNRRITKPAPAKAVVTRTLGAWLVAAIVAAVTGTILGSSLGLGVSVLLARITPLPVIVTWEPFALALAFALLVGTFFGVQPARRAARLHPVESMR